MNDEKRLASLLKAVVMARLTFCVSIDDLADAGGRDRRAVRVESRAPRQPALHGRLLCVPY